MQDLFFKFPWNNFLHSQVEGCIRAALFSTTANNANDGGSEEQFPLKYHVRILNVYSIYLCTSIAVHFFTVSLKYMYNYFCNQD